MASKKSVKSSRTKSTGTNLITPELVRIYAEFRQEEKKTIDRNNVLIKKNQENAEALFARGCAHKHLTKYQLAIEDFTKVININDKHAPSYYKRCLALLALGHYNQALKDADKYLELCSSEYKHLAYFNRAVCHLKMSSLEKAYDDFNKAIALKPDDVFYRCCQARIEPTKQESKRQSSLICTKLSHSISSDSFFTRAMALQEYGRSVEAFKCFEEAFKRDPMNIDAFFQIGVYHADLNDHEQAITIFDQLLKLLPDDSRTLQHRGMSYAALGDYEKARKDFNLALENNESAIIYFERGLLYFKLGNQQINSSTQTQADTQLAMKDLTKTIDIDPNRSIADLILALANAQENSLKDGLQTLNNIVEKNFDSIVDEIKREEKQLSKFEDMLSDFKNQLNNQNNMNPELKAKIFDMEKQFQQLNDQVNTLSSVRDKAQIVHEKMKSFKKTDIRLFRFYQRLNTKAEELFYAFKVIASRKVDPSSGGGKLDKAATVVELSGQALSLMPMVGTIPEQVLTQVSSGLQYIDKERQINIATRIGKMDTMIGIWGEIQDMAIDLTEKYELQIKKIFDKPRNPIEVPETKPDTETKSDTKKKRKCPSCCCNITEIKNTILAKQEPYMTEKVAEYAISLLMDGLIAKRVNNEAEASLSTQFVQCVCTGEDPCILSLFQDSKIETIEEEEEKKWTMHGFFREVGIKTKEGDLYGGEKIHIDIYGFRNGTKEEAHGMGLTLISTDVNK